MHTGIFFDVDGTLRDIRTSSIPESAAKSLRRLRESGYKLGIATGRAIDEIEDDIKGLVDWDAYVCVNGNAVYTKDAGKIYELCFSGEVIAKCFEIAARTGRPLQLTTCDSVIYLTREPDEETLSVYKIFGITVPEVKPYRGEPITGIMAFGDCENDFKEYAEIAGITYFRGVGRYADIAYAGVSKHSGIVLAMKHYGLSDYIAFGDSLNDVEMLQNARISIAMGESEQKIIETADYHTGKVMDDGIERACEALK